MVSAFAAILGARRPVASHLRLIRRHAAATRPVPRGLVESLRRAWGNSFWRADAGFLLAVLDWLARSNGAVLECGSGLSTLALAAAAAPAGRPVVTLEHHAHWAETVARAAPRSLYPTLRVNLAPLRSYGDFDWYDVERLPPGPPFGMVVCDGPPGRTRGGRYGLVPVMRTRLAADALILIDDTHRRAERRIVERWCEELPARIVDRQRSRVVLQRR